MDRAVAFLATDEGRRPLGLYVADLHACDPRRIARVDSPHAFAWTPDGRSIVFSQLALVDNARVFADLYRVEIASGAITRLTRSARLASPDVHPDGRTIVAVQYDNDRSRLVTVDVESGTIAPLTEFSTAIAWGPARWSPDGTRLAAVRFTRGASFDLVLLSADGRLLQSLTDDRALEGVPEWDASAPAGVRRLFFTSDRTGVRELYGLELEGDGRPSSLFDGAGRDRTPRGGGRPDARVSRVMRAHLAPSSVGRRSWPSSRTRMAVISNGSRSTAPPGSRRPHLLPNTLNGPAILRPRLPRSIRRRPSRYSPARDLFPTGWSPVFETVEELGLFAGAATGGVDVIGRHAWQGNAAYGPDGRTIGSASYVYRRFRRAQLFGQVASTWRLEQRIESDAGELLRLERKRSAAAGVVFPWATLRRTTLFSASLEIEDRHRENSGDIGGSIRRRSGPAGSHARRRRSGTEFRQCAGGAAVDFGSGRRPDVGVDRLPRGHRGRSLAFGLGCGGIRLSIVSVMDDGWTTGVCGDRAHRRTTRAGGQSPDRRRCGNDGRPRRPAIPTSRFAAIRRDLWRPTRSGAPGPRCVCRSRASAAVLGRCRSICAACPDRGSSTASGRQAVSIGWDPRNFFPRAPSCRATSRCSRFFPIRIRTGVGVPLKSLGPVSRGEARFYVTAGTSF